VNVWEPTFLVNIEGTALSRDVTQEILSFVFEDNEEESDLLEITFANRNGQFTDDPLFQEGNVIAVKFGYVGEMSGLRKCVIKEIDYDFPVGVPTIKLKAYDHGINLAANDEQKAWTTTPPGITASEIAEQIAAKHGLKAVIEPSSDRLPKVAQANESDAQFLMRLAKEARPKSGDECAGYSFYIEGDELHFHPPAIDSPPKHTLEYFGNGEGILQSFQPETLTQFNNAGAGQVTAKGVDPRTKAASEAVASNEETPDRPVLGDVHLNLSTGQAEEVEPPKGKILPDSSGSATRLEDSDRPPGKDKADAVFKQAEGMQIKATAETIGVPSLRAKTNVEILGVGRKFSGTWYVASVRHVFKDGYACELKLRKNAAGKGAGDKAAKPTEGEQNKQEPDTKDEAKLQVETIDLETGGSS
jgi:uncharacterized protein